MHLGRGGTGGSIHIPDNAKGQTHSAIAMIFSRSQILCSSFAIPATLIPFAYSPLTCSHSTKVNLCAYISQHEVTHREVIVTDPLGPLRVRGRTRCSRGILDVDVVVVAERLVKGPCNGGGGGGAWGHARGPRDTCPPHPRSTTRAQARGCTRPLHFRLNAEGPIERFGRLRFAAAAFKTVRTQIHHLWWAWLLPLANARGGRAASCREVRRAGRLAGNGPHNQSANTLPRALRCTAPAACPCSQVRSTVTVCGCSFWGVMESRVFT